MTGKRLFLDMDGTLARFHDEVNFLEKMFEPGFSKSLQPFSNLVDAVKLFVKEHPDVEVFILSAVVYSPTCISDKNAWLDRYLPEIDADHRIYTQVGDHKSEYIAGGVGENDFLLDDYNRGLNQFEFDGGNAIKCHNNINQKGIGAYGGSSGRMWTGPMVHTEDPAELIAAELACHMGLEFDLEKVCLKQGIRSVEDPDTEINGPGSYIKFPDSPDAFYIAYTVDTDKYIYSTPFKDFFNCIHWLCGREEYAEITLRPTIGKPFCASAMQLEAASLNVYGTKNFRHFLRADRTQFADDMTLEISEAKQPLIGVIHYLDPNGKEFENAAFRTYQQMKDACKYAQEDGLCYEEEWYIQPVRAKLQEINKENSPHRYSLASIIDSAEHKRMRHEGALNTPKEHSHTM